MNTKKYHCLDPYLHEISRLEVSYDRDLRKLYNSMLNEILYSLLHLMKEKDSIFKELYKQMHYSGSSYENLRIKSPNEFDLNLELKLPVSKYKLEIAENAFLTINSVDFKTHSQARIRSWVDKDNFLLRTAVIQWFTGVVDKALKDFHTSAYEIRRTRSGPAVTLNITCLSNPAIEEFSVDLVPVFIFGSKDWPKSPVRQLQKKEICDKWCVVPKAQNAANLKLWRMSFYYQEKIILNDKTSLKHIIKLIKLLRDKENWKWMASYYIKTVFLWKDSQSEDSFWRQSIGVIFMHMLYEFQNVLANERIPFFWANSYNLIESVNKYEIFKTKNRFAAIIRKLDMKIEDPSFIKTFFRKTGDEPCVMGIIKQMQEMISNESETESLSSSELLPQQSQTGVMEVIKGVTIGVGIIGLVSLGVAVAAGLSRNGSKK